MYSDLLNEAKSRILPFWMNLKDEKYGSYYGVIDNDLNLNQKGDKGGIATARLLWSFAAAYNTFKDPTYLEHASHVYNFLKEKVIDYEHGGLYWMLSYDGEVVDNRKHVYAQSFGIYSLTEYYTATKKPEVLELAFDLFKLVESSGFNQEYNIYGEEYSIDWQLKENEMLSENGVKAEITTNTLLHVLEAYTNLYKVTKDPQVGDRLKFLVDIFVEKIWNKTNDHMHVFFDYSWNEIIDLQSYGHDIEATWLVDDALRLLGLDKEEKYSSFVTNIADKIKQVALEDNGALIYEMEKGQLNRERVWWCQAEAIVGFVNMYQRTGTDTYLDKAELIWDYTKDYIIDQREGGEWHAVLNRFDRPLNDSIVEPWKTPYHNLRACLEVINRLEKVKGM